MEKNYYDVLVIGDDGLNKEVLKNVRYEIANLKVLSLRAKGKNADIWYNFHKYRTTPITKDNIHLYYEFMSDDELQKNNKILSKVFDERFAPICFGLKLDVQKLQGNMKFAYIYNKIVEQEVFGVKDVLKPIDEYIKEIKESSEYKNYINYLN